MKNAKLSDICNIMWKITYFCRPKLCCTDTRQNNYRLQESRRALPQILPATVKLSSWDNDPKSFQWETPIMAELYFRLWIWWQILNQTACSFLFILAVKFSFIALILREKCMWHTDRWTMCTVPILADEWMSKGLTFNVHIIRNFRDGFYRSNDPTVSKH